MSDPRRKTPAEATCPFGASSEPSRRPESCPRCGSAATSVDYGSVDDDNQIPAAVKAGKIPAYCESCGHHFYGNWRS